MSGSSELLLIKDHIVVARDHNLMRVLLIPQPVHEIQHIIYCAIVCKVATVDEQVTFADIQFTCLRVRVGYAADF